VVLPLVASRHRVTLPRWCVRAHPTHRTGTTRYQWATTRTVASRVMGRSTSRAAEVAVADRRAALVTTPVVGACVGPAHPLVNGSDWRPDRVRRGRDSRAVGRIAASDHQ
jgi:hypothetical protein